MKKTMVLKFRTGIVQSWGIVLIGFFVVFGAPGSVYVILSESPILQHIWIKGFLLLVALGGMFTSSCALYAFLIDVWSLEMDGSVLMGRTLFGFKRTIKLEDVRSLKVGWQNNCILRTEVGERFGIAAAIDYDGFIIDYILLRLQPGTEIDERGIAKLRGNEDHWLYARRPPYDADYPADYLIWLEGVVREQKLALMKKGVLSRNRSYEGRKNLYQSGR